MPSKTRLANKTIYAIEDITALARSARRNINAAIDLATHRLDLRTVAQLAQAQGKVAEIESLARDARQGKYRGKDEFEEGD